MKTAIKLFLCILLCLISNVLPQEINKAELEKGVTLIATKIYSNEENTKILKLYNGLRVVDVSDGMDMVGLPCTGLVDPVIHADWIDRENLSHQFRCIAVTARYVPTQQPDRPQPGEKFQEWEGYFYNAYSHEAFAKIIKPGTVVVIDDVDEKDIGSIGSYNILAWHKLGAIGVVTDASSRDTDEIAIEKVPLYLRKKGRGIRPGRNELESVNRPVVIGGVLVCPGDIVVADGDGVIVVPRNVAEQVAKYAREILDKDKVGRKRTTDLLTVSGTQFVIMRWDLSAFAVKRMVGSGLLELTTHTLQRSSDYLKDFGMVRVVEIMSGDREWNEKEVTFNKLCQKQPLSQVLNSQMIIDIEVAPGRDSKNLITISNPVLQRMIDGKTLGLALRPLGAVNASFDAKENQLENFSPKLHINVDSH